MLEVSHGKTLSGSFVFAGLAYGLLLFFVVLVWFLPERAEVLAHFRAYMLPAIIFGLMGKLMDRKSGGSAEKIGKLLLGIAYVCCGAFIGLFIYTFLTGQ